MPKFKKRPLVVEAIRLRRTMTIDTPEGTLFAGPGDWLVTGIRGEQYPVKHDIFLETYEPVNDEANEYLEKHRDGQR